MLPCSGADYRPAQLLRGLMLNGVTPQVGRCLERRIYGMQVAAKCTSDVRAYLATDQSLPFLQREKARGTESKEEI